MDKQVYTNFEPSVNNVFMASTIESVMLKDIEEAGRVCYKSEDRITEDSYKNFLKMIFTRTDSEGVRHFSVLEHSNICFRIFNTFLNEIEIPYFSSQHFPRVQDGLDVVIASNLRGWIEYLVYLIQLEDFKGTPIRVHAFNSCVSTIVDGLAYYYPETMDTLCECIPAFGEYYQPTPKNFEGNNTKDTIELVAIKEQVELTEKYGVPFTYVIAYITTSRDITHEAVRSRSLSFSQESTRYCNYNNKPLMFLEPKLISESEDAQVLINGIHSFCAGTYLKLLDLSTAPQMARDILPHSLKTDIVISGRIPPKTHGLSGICDLTFGWTRFFNLRNSKAAHPHIRPLSMKIQEMYNNLISTGYVGR